MVEVIKKSAYLVDGQIVYADQAQNMASLTRPVSVWPPSWYNC